MKGAKQCSVLNIVLQDSLGEDDVLEKECFITPTSIEQAKKPGWGLGVHMLRSLI